MPGLHHEMFVSLIQYGRPSVVWLQEIAPSEFTCFDDYEQSNLSGQFVQSVLSVPSSLVHKLLYKTQRESRESKLKSLQTHKKMMNLIKKKGKKT